MILRIAIFMICETLRHHAFAVKGRIIVLNAPDDLYASEGVGCAPGPGIGSAGDINGFEIGANCTAVELNIIGKDCMSIVGIDPDLLDSRQSNARYFSGGLIRCAIQFDRIVLDHEVTRRNSQKIKVDAHFTVRGCVSPFAFDGNKAGILMLRRASRDQN